MTEDESQEAEWIGWGRPAQASKKAMWHLWKADAAGKATVCKVTRDVLPPKRFRTHVPKGRTCSPCVQAWEEAVGSIVGKCVYCSTTVVPVMSKSGIADLRVRARDVPDEGYAKTITCFEHLGVDRDPEPGAPFLDEASLTRRFNARRAARNLLLDGVVLP